jgi:hypothetical protein
MCRSIRPLRGRAVPPPTTGDVEDAARQYLRKVAAVRSPGARHQDAFELALEEVTAATDRLLAALGARPVEGPPTPPSEWPRRPARRETSAPQPAAINPAP